MKAEFFLFNVEQGQFAALHTPNGRWCIFDVGRTDTFSPVNWIVDRNSRKNKNTPITQLLGANSFRFLKATISHFHGDHLADWQNMAKFKPESMRTIQPDPEHIKDSKDSNSEQSWPLIFDFINHFGHAGLSLLGSDKDYGGAVIREMSLPVAIARQIGGDANAHVNNASIVTRIDVYRNSILICGDMLKEAWEYIISDYIQLGATWRSFLSNIDILVAPHHGHKSGYSIDMLNLTKPAVVLISVKNKDPNVDCRYSEPPVQGITIGNTLFRYISTRKSGHIKVDIHSPSLLCFGMKGDTYWTFGDAVLR